MKQTWTPFLVLADFTTCFPFKKPGDIAIISSIFTLVQRWRVSWIKSTLRLLTIWTHISQFSPVILVRPLSLHVFTNDNTKSATAVCFNSSLLRKPLEVTPTSKPLQSLTLATTTPPLPGTVCLQQHWSNSVNRPSSVWSYFQMKLILSHPRILTLLTVKMAGIEYKVCPNTIDHLDTFLSVNVFLRNSVKFIRIFK